jgi:hypothetical protein
VRLVHQAGLALTSGALLIQPEPVINGLCVDQDIANAVFGGAANNACMHADA